MNRHNPVQSGEDKDPVKALNLGSLRGKLKLNMQKETAHLCLFWSVKADGEASSFFYEARMTTYCLNHMSQSLREN